MPKVEDIVFKHTLKAGEVYPEAHTHFCPDENSCVFILKAQRRKSDITLGFVSGSLAIGIILTIIYLIL